MSLRARFRTAYAAHRAAEGRGHDCAELLSLPYVASGPLVQEWAVRARSFEAFDRRVLQAHPLRLVDLGAGSGWLCYRAALAGIYCLAVDVRDDTIDGLGAAECYMRLTRFDRAVASFDALPLPDRYFDVAVFNASLHYALDLTTVLGEASRVVKRGGRLVILDSPFYAREAHGEAMVAEKRRDAEHRFGPRAEALTTLPFAEYLTRGRLKAASAGLGLVWRRRRVRYPVWYETRRLFAWLHRRRSPSRFDLWESTVI